MPDLLEPADPRGGDRALIEARGLAAPTLPAPAPLSAARRGRWTGRSCSLTMSPNGMVR